MFKLQSPIQDAIRDPKKIKTFFDKWKLVPQYGDSQTSSHSLLKTLCDLNKLSPSAVSCKGDIQTYAFDGDLDIVSRVAPGIKRDRRELSEAEKDTFIEAVYGVGLNFLKIQQIVSRSFENYIDTGNKYIHCRIATVNGESRVFLNVILPLHAMYLLSEEDEPRTLVITDTWDPRKGS